MITTLTALVIGYLALTPLIYLLWGTFFDENGFTLRFFREAYSAPGVVAMGLNSLLFTFGSTFLAVTLGTILAYLLVRTDVPFKRALFALCLVPLIIPGILHTIAWIFLLSPRAGVINVFSTEIIGQPLFSVFSMGGMIWVQGLHLSPLVFLLLTATFRSMDPALEESALMSGARIPAVFRRVTLPVAAPALFAAVLLMVVRSLEAFEVPALLGIPHGILVFTSVIWRALNTFPRQFGLAGAYSLSLLCLTAVGVYLHVRLFANRGFQTITGRGFRPRVIELGQWRIAATAFVFLYLAVTVLLPLGILAFASFQDFFLSRNYQDVSTMSLDNYRDAFGEEQTIRAFRNSIVLGIGSATIVLVLTSIAAWLVVRTRARGRFLLEGVATVPLVIPGIIIGVSMLFLYLRHPLPIYGTLWILLIAYVTAHLPYGMQYAAASMSQIGSELEESARVSGASWWKTFRLVLLPLMAPGLVAGWIYILITSFRELSSSLLIYSPGNEVVPVRIWELWRDGAATRLAALGMVMVVGILVLVAIASRLGSRAGIGPAR